MGLKTTLDDKAGRRPLLGSKRSDGPEIAAGIALSVLFHGGIVVALVLSVVLASGEVEEDEGYEVVFDDVSLLALGEEPDPDMMPRLTGDEGAPPEPDVVDPDQEPTEVDPEPEVEPDPEQAEPDPEQLERQRQEEAQREEEERLEEERRRREERRRQMQEATGRFDADGRGDEAPEGSPHGVAGGTVTDEDMADMEQTYYVRVLREIERHWQIPRTLSDDEVAALAGKVVVFVELSDEGHVRNYEFRQESGNEQFDDSIERVIRQFEAGTGGQRLPLPEGDEIRAEVLNRGLRLARWEVIDR